MTQPTSRVTTWVIVSAIVAAVVAAAVITLVVATSDDELTAISAADGDPATGTSDAEPTDEADPTEPGGEEPGVVEAPIGEFGTPVVSGTRLAPVPGSGEDPAVGTVAPVVEGTDFFGAPVVIAPGNGATLVVFLAHWCPHCNAEAPRLAEAAATGLPEGVRVVVVPTGSQSGAPHWPPSRWVQEMGVVELPTVVDDAAGTIASAYGLESFPYTVLLDDRNLVVARFIGTQAHDFFPQVLQAAADL